MRVLVCTSACAESLKYPCCPHLSLMVQEQRSTTAQVGDVSLVAPLLPHERFIQPVNGSKQIRRQLRALRRSISPRDQRLHSRSISRLIARSPTFQNSRRVAFYLSTDGEIDLSSLIQRAGSAGKRCFLPVLRRRPGLSLWFVQYDTNAKLIPNRFGICEPVLQQHKVAMPWGLDLILLPLVGFDLSGNRLGMGGGYYDRTLSYLRHRRHWITPLLIGVAHQCQKVDALIANPWDIPLNGVVTEDAFYAFDKRTQPY